MKPEPLTATDHEAETAAYERRVARRQREAIEGTCSICASMGRTCGRCAAYLAKATASTDRRRGAAANRVAA